MSFSTLPTFTQDKVVDVDYLNLVKGNLDDHETRLAQVVGSIVPNGSFESFEVASPYYANNWGRTHYTGGSSGTQSSDQAEGARCLFITSPGGSGNGGGYYDSDYVFCTPLKPVTLQFEHWASAAGIHNQVLLRWYDKDKVYISETALYDSSANPTGKTLFILGANPPATAKFFKVRLIGAKNDNTTAGTAYFDGLLLLALAAAPVLIDQPEVQTTAATFTDVGSQGIWIPYGVKNLVIRGNLHSFSGSYTAYCRWRVSGTYSDEKSVTGLAYVPVVNTLDVSGLVGTFVSLVIQLKNSTISFAATYKKDQTTDREGMNSYFL